MKNINKKKYYFAGFIFIFFIFCIFQNMALPIKINEDENKIIVEQNIEDIKEKTFTFNKSRDFLWSVYINCSENLNGQSDYVIIQEDTNSSDGPPNDPYDVMDPPPSPNQNINSYLNDNLPIPFNNLFVDSRYGPDSDFYKIFNLTISWLYEPSTTQINISWNPGDINRSEYLFVNLTDNSYTFLANMKNVSCYNFTANPFTYNYFHIVCEKQAPPDVGVINIIKPQGIIPIGGPSDVQIKVKNYCVQNLNNLQVNCKILDNISNIVYNNNKTIDLYPLKELNVYFPDWIPTSQGNYTINACTILTNDKNASNDCIFSNVTVNILPVSNFSFEPSNPRTTNIINFTDYSYDSDGYIVNWTWDFGDGNLGYTGNISYQFTDNGIYLVCLTVTDNDGYTHTNCEPIEVLSAIPIADFDYTPDEPSTLDLIYFTDLSYDLDGMIVNWSWDFGDGNISYIKNPTHQYLNDGSYLVYLSIKDDDNEINTSLKLVNVSNIDPSANFSYTPANPSTVSIVQFIDLSTDFDGNIVNWTWNFDDGNDSYNQNPIHQFNEEREYNISLKVKDDDGSENTTIKKLTVSNSIPQSKFSFIPVNPYNLDDIQFIDNSSDLDGYITSWYWDFGDGNTSNLQNPTHSYGDNGDYYVCLTVTDDDGAVDTNCSIITVLNIQPTANFTYQPINPIQIIDTIQFYDISNDIDGIITTWEWDFGDGNTSNLQNPTHSYGDNGDYYVCLTVTDDDGGVDTNCYTINVINIQPIANFSHIPLLPVTTDVIEFTDTSFDIDGILLSWYWDFGDGNTSTIQNPTHQYASSGRYPVSLQTTDDDGTIDMTTKLILVDIQIMNYTGLSHGWNLISLPFNLSFNKDDIIIKYDNYYYSFYDGLVSTFIFGWNRTNQYYFVSDNIIPGYGYWIWAYDDCEIWLENLTLPPEDPFITHLDTGWNLVGVPHDQIVNKTDILVNDISWSNAVPMGVVSDFIFGWDRSGQYYNLANVLIPRFSYWIYAYQPCTLKRII